MSTNNESKKPQTSPEKDLLEGVRFEPSTESTKNEPTPEKAQELKQKQTQTQEK